MKITVQVDLSEMYSEDDEQSFNSQILDSIAYEVKSKVMTDFRNKGFEVVEQSARQLINTDFEKEIETTVKNIFDFKVVRDGKTYKQLVEEKISTNTYFTDAGRAEKWINSILDPLQGKIIDAVKSEAIKIGQELSNRYDLLFASQLVAKMNEAGLLKEDVANLLLPKKEEQ